MGNLESTVEGRRSTASETALDANAADTTTGPSSQMDVETESKFAVRHFWPSTVDRRPSTLPSGLRRRDGHGIQIGVVNGHGAQFLQHRFDFLAFADHDDGQLVIAQVFPG